DDPAAAAEACPGERRRLVPAAVAPDRDAQRSRGLLREQVLDASPDHVLLVRRREDDFERTRNVRRAGRLRPAPGAPRGPRRIGQMRRGRERGGEGAGAGAEAPGDPRPGAPRGPPPATRPPLARQSCAASTRRRAAAAWALRVSGSARSSSTAAAKS